METTGVKIGGGSGDEGRAVAKWRFPVYVGRLVLELYQKSLHGLVRDRKFIYKEGMRFIRVCHLSCEEPATLRRFMQNRMQVREGRAIYAGATRSHWDVRIFFVYLSPSLQKVAVRAGAIPQFEAIKTVSAFRAEYNEHGQIVNADEGGWIKPEIWRE